MNTNKSMAKNPYLHYLIFGVVMALLPMLVKTGIFKSAHVTLIGGVLIYAIVSLGLNLLLGYSGLISLGTAGFMGLASYITSYVTKDMGLPFGVGLLLAIVIPLAIGLLVGLISLKIEGLYLAIATLCVSEILRKTFEEFDMFTNGFSGKTTDYPVLFGFLKLDRDGTYLLLVVLLVIVMVITHNLVNGQMGRALHAMRGSEVAAQAMGVNLMKYRLVAFALATAYAALGGALYSHFVKFSYPSLWTMGMSLNILAVIVIGGLRSIPGTILGTFIVFAMPDLILKRIPVLGAMNGFPYIFNGVLIILVILFYPHGAIYLLQDLKKLVGRVFKGKGKGGEANV